MDRLLALVLLLTLVGCDLTPPAEPGARPTAASTADHAAPELPAAEPPPPSLELFTAQAATACATALGVRDARPLRGDPLAAYATPRDVRAAVQHYRAVARGWSQAASALFAFGTPEDPRGQRFIAALDVLAMRSRQVADALASGDDEAAQLALGAAEQALFEADASGRALGLGPLTQCAGTGSEQQGQQRVVVNGVDFSFRLADDVFSPGPTRFIMRNRGVEEHQLFVVPLRQPGTLAAAVAADRRGERLTPFVAGPGAATAVARPGERVTVDLDLRPGPYGFVCYVASPDGTPHAYKGMASEVMVEG